MLRDAKNLKKTQKLIELLKVFNMRLNKYEEGKASMYNDPLIHKRPKVKTIKRKVKNS